MTNTPVHQQEPGRLDVMHILGGDVKTAFAAGGPLVKDSAFQVHASRRTEPGQAELHDFETDIFHILQGEATLVVGGTITEQVEIEPHQHRGAGIIHGKNITLREDDVIIIPRGVPHWFAAINIAPLLYYTVKVIEES